MREKRRIKSEKGKKSEKEAHAFFLQEGEK